MITRKDITKHHPPKLKWKTKNILVTQSSRIKKDRRRDSSRNSIKIFTNTIFFINMGRNSENRRLGKTSILVLKLTLRNQFSERKNLTLIQNMSLVPPAQRNSFPPVFHVEEKDRFTIESIGRKWGVSTAQAKVLKTSAQTVSEQATS
jgi:hypothetical protein